MRARSAMLAMAVGLAWSTSLAAQADLHLMFAQAEREERVGIARKTMPVDVRPAESGEVVVTYRRRGQGNREPAGAAG